ncbi:AmmeMemoRadiSam system protein A [Marinobacterium arenosum]|uniref:AmmeMemoRadiSam system protein A n=1 Tax=Marinobacterium arenosum TaxID=2862496 RepID=UPI001C968304|nr:AmmeMemoRadiSam system protein A [Marinobacterium arenosum]MBY4675250.1 AmmeMemoRadiSam system protein A [Marinobacterium arenosum]
MAPTPFTELEKHRLLTLARRSIRDCFEQAESPDKLTSGISIDCAGLTRLQQPSCCFVTLLLADQLRGCMGTLEEDRPLAEAVQHNARAAAFRDPRFLPLQPEELDRCRIEISVLSEPRPFPVASEAELLTALEPNRHGLIIGFGKKRGLFLPAVWQSLPKPDEFVRQLKRKIGLPTDFWSDQVQVELFQSETLSD